MKVYQLWFTDQDETWIDIGHFTEKESAQQLMDKLIEELPLTASAEQNDNGWTFEISTIVVYTSPAPHHDLVGKALDEIRHIVDDLDELRPPKPEPEIEFIPSPGQQGFGL